MTDTQGAPVTWAALLSSDLGDRWLKHLQGLPETLQDDLARPFWDLSMVAMQFSCALCLKGSDKLRPVVDAIRPQIEFARKSVELDPTGGPASVRLGGLSTWNALDCGGLVTAPFGGLDAGAMLDVLAKSVGDLPEPRQHTAGLAAVAAGRTKLVPKFVGGGKLPAKFVGGETFMFNVPGFVRYMAVAADKGAQAADVEPAWRDFVAAFPRKLAAETLDWPDLLWAGRIYYVHFEKRAPADVSSAIHSLVAAT